MKNDPTRTQLLVRFGYDGSRFKGLQPQLPSIPTAGQALKDRLTAAADEAPHGLNFAARTDSGVHALRNLATCWYRHRSAEQVQALCAALQLPRDDGLVAVHATVVPMQVHARGSSRGKRYRYLIDDSAVVDDNAAARFAWRVVPALSLEAMRAAAAHLVGTHDFASLRGQGCQASSTTKTIVTLRLGGPFPLTDGSRRFVVEICGDGFLRHMVRNLVGLVVEVGAGWRAADTIPDVLEARARRAAGLMAPAAGLTLVEVGCAWPADGSGLVRELRGYSPGGDDDDDDGAASAQA